MKCLVTGAAGFVGSHLAEALVARDCQVRCLVRRTSNLTWLRGLPVELVQGDIGQPDSLRPALGDVDYVYHVAGLTRALRNGDFLIVNAEGTANLLEACLASATRVQQIVLVSSLSAVGPAVDGRPLREGDACRPVTPYGRSKLRAEKIADSYRGRLPIAVVRPAVIYGPRDRDSLVLFKTIQRGLRPITRKPRTFSLIDVRDLVLGLIAAAEHPTAAGRTYHLANAEPETFEHITELMARALGRHPITLRLPAAAFYLSGGLQELAARARRHPVVFDRDKARELAQPYWVCDTGRARTELGFEPRISVDQGVRDTAGWYRQAGWL